jgi:hypothetical protein
MGMMASPPPSDGRWRHTLHARGWATNWIILAVLLLAIIEPSSPFTHFTYSGKGWSTLKRAAKEACHRRHPEAAMFSLKSGKSESHREQPESLDAAKDVGAAFDSVTGYGDMTGMKQVRSLP